MAKQFFCPICRKPVARLEENPYRPFCSRRCKLIDLGEWASGNRYIPGERVSPEKEDDSHEFDHTFWKS